MKRIEQKNSQQQRQQPHHQIHYWNWSSKCKGHEIALYVSDANEFTKDSFYPYQLVINEIKPIRQQQPNYHK